MSHVLGPEELIENLQHTCSSGIFGRIPFGSCCLAVD